MLQINKNASQALGESTPWGNSHLTDALSSFGGTIKRQLPVFLIVIAVVITLGVAYLLTTPSSYTASATLVIDARKVQLFQQQSVLADSPVDAGTVQTQVEILKSQNISLAVIKNLKLTEDPEFVGVGGGVFGVVFNLLSNAFDTAGPMSDVQLTRKALSNFESHRTINRVGLTYVMEIAFRSLDPDKSARIANAIADAYIVDQLQAKYQATRRASNWLQDRIQELRAESSVAERAVVDFKQQNNIVDTGGRLMNDQQLTEVSSQLILARAATAEAKARLDRIQQVMKQDLPDASVADSLKSQVIIKLRQQYLELAGREAIWSSKYGFNHLASINLRNQMQELRSNITDEMRKIAESYKSDYEISQTREASIQNSLDSSISQSRLTNQAQIKLRELESNAQSYRAMYDNFLQRYMEAVQQQSFPISEARLISPATRPLYRSQPNTLVVLGVTGFGGLALAFGVALLREMSDRVFRTTAQVEENLKVNCIAILPALKPADVRKNTRKDKTAAVMEPRRIGHSSALLQYVVDAPFSQFTEALRSLKVVMDLNGVLKPNRVIGVTSTLPNEGKSTIASNFAELIAHSGAKVILIDSDLRNPSLSSGLAPASLVGGLVDVLAGRAELDDVTWRDDTTGLTFLPAGAAAKKLVHTNEVLASAAFKTLIDRLRDHYDYVIVDFPPLAPVVDTRTTTNFIDAYVYVVEWGCTQTDMVEHTLADAPEVYDRLLGVVLNKADMSMLGRYESYRSSYYYRKYAKYGYTD